VALDVGSAPFPERITETLVLAWIICFSLWATIRVLLELVRDLALGDIWRRASSNYKAMLYL